MANIQTLLAKIMSAIYGEEVRGAIHDSIEAINDEVETWTGLQDGTVTTAKLANTSVTTAKVADGAITRAKLNADVVDTTLAVSGAPADAKKVGDVTSELKTAIQTLSNYGGILYTKPKALAGTTLFTSAEAPAETVLHYSFTVESGKSGYLEFFDSEDARITYIGKGSSGGGALEYEGTYTIPSNFSYCKYSGTVLSEGTFEYLCTDESLKVLNEKVIGLSEKLENLLTITDINAVPTTGGLYSIVTHGYYANPSYSYYLLPANEYDEVYVTSQSNVNCPIAMFYSDTETLDESTWLGSYGSYSSSIQYTDEKLVIPAGTKMIAVNNYGGTFGIKKAMLISENSKYINAEYDNASVTMETKNIVIKMGKTGGNDLFDFISIKKTDGTVVLNNGTDFFAPYKVRAVSNADGDLPDNWTSAFVGGNHQYNNAGSGSTPTARGTIDYVMFDGKKVSEGDSASCDIVEIQWTNYIQGQNTKKADGTGREILKEIYKLVYDGIEMKISHAFVPLENVLIITYYGLQLYNNLTGTKFRYIGGSNRQEVTAQSETNSGSKNCREVVSYNSDYVASMKMNNVDIGSFDLDSYAYSAFVTTSNKAYFLPIMPSVNTQFNTGDYYYFDGAYKFETI